MSVCCIGSTYCSQSPWQLGEANAVALDNWRLHVDPLASAPIIGTH